ncbi:hypothetical protein [Salinilacihabitans rarus]|uniref:hypothetical protein n=1 Tax=Salinilacihabitans rarus TaxID=2961596 RepID=UPI0020C8575A|nr:hypothetical protein [Salinilacihabitans rarus]
MTGERTPRSRRRAFLAGLAASAGVALAGCSEVRPSETDSTTFTAADAEAVLADAPSPPAVKWPVPVRPERGAREAAIERVDELLADVPESLGPDDVPNGVVRESIAEHRDDAVRTRGEAADATGDDLYHALRDLREARESARASSTTLRAIDEEMEALVDDLATERETVRSAIEDRRGGIEYRGDDADDGRLRAALYYQQLESDLDRATASLDRRRVDANVIEVGETAGDVEFATATADVWDHFEERYEAGLDDATTFEPIFEAALDRSIDRAAAVDFPEQDGEEWYDAVGVGDLDDDRLEFTLWRFGGSVVDARDGTETARADGDLGTGLYRALEFERTYRAFERLRDRMAEGTVAAPSDVAEIRDERERAIEAAAAAREELPVSEPSPGSYALSETLRSFEWIDGTVRRAADHDPEVVVSIDKEYGRYARLRAELEVLPEAVAAFRDRLLAD